MPYLVGTGRALCPVRECWSCLQIVPLSGCTGRAGAFAISPSGIFVLSDVPWSASFFDASRICLFGASMTCAAWEALVVLADYALFAFLPRPCQGYNLTFAVCPLMPQCCALVEARGCAACPCRAAVDALAYCALVSSMVVLPNAICCMKLPRFALVENASCLQISWNDARGGATHVLKVCVLLPAYLSVPSIAGGGSDGTSYPHTPPAAQHEDIQAGAGAWQASAGQVHEGLTRVAALLQSLGAWLSRALRVLQHPKLHIATLLQSVAAWLFQPFRQCNTPNCILPRSYRVWAAGFFFFFFFFGHVVWSSP